MPADTQMGWCSLDACLPSPSTLSLGADYISVWKLGIPVLMRAPKYLDGGQKVTYFPKRLSL